MEFVESLKDILLYKMSTTMAQNTFMKEFNEIYMESEKKEQDFLERSINQIFRKYYYSVVEPGTYISPANIMSTLAERESAGNNIFVPRVELIKENGVLARIKSTLHYVNAETNYMVTDFETVLEICKAGLRVNQFGIPEEGERKKFEGRLFLNDRHYLNIILLVAISLKYIRIFNQGKKLLARTTQKSEEVLAMTVKQKIKLLAEGIVDNFIDSFDLNIPELKGVITKDIAWELMKNPLKLGDVFEAINEKIGIDLNPLTKLLGKEVDFEQVEEMFLDNSLSPLVLLCFIQMDVFFFTPLSYYLQLIKPFYHEVYNITIEMANIFNILSEDFNHARNMLFSMPIEFDLTLLGEEILLECGESKPKQKIPKKYKDKSFLKCFEIREQYLEQGLEDFCESYEEDYEVEEDFEQYADNYDKVIDIFDYKFGDKRTKGRDENQTYIQPVEMRSEIQDALYVFKVKNYYAKTSWILVEIQGGTTLEDLHEVISNEFNLEWGHLYSFFTGGKFWDEDTEYCHPEADGRKKANRVKIGSLKLIEGSKIVYIYDYGDELRFELECKHIAQTEKGVAYPRVSKKSKKFIEEEE